MSAEIQLNGRAVTVQSGPGRTLLDGLREDLGITSCKYGCGEGVCGACTVLIDGSAARACQTDPATLGTLPVRTLEDLSKDGKLHPVQQAFLDAGAFQCGFCTCGMILAAVALLEETPEPTDDQINAGMNGNICRCGGYPEIREAIRKAAATLRNAEK